MHLHFQRDVSQDPITGDLSGYDLHDFGPTSELLVEPLDDVGGSQRNPLFFASLASFAVQSLIPPYQPSPWRCRRHDTPLI